MKNQNLVFAIAIAALVSCGSLPEPTQEGRNTLGMKINGVNWNASGFGALVEAGYYESENNLLVIVARANSGNRDLIMVANEIVGIGEYNIGFRNTGPTRIDSTIYSINDNYEDAFGLQLGQENKLTITKFDLQKNIVSGYFYMKMVNRHGEILSITEGRFDVNFINML